MTEVPAQNGSLVAAHEWFALLNDLLISRAKLIAALQDAQKQIGELQSKLANKP